LQDLPLVLSGMASSGLGMKELPYAPVPFRATGEDLYRLLIPASVDFSHSMLLISGARTTDDVMRGEETQLVGAFSPADNGERLYIFPGTHSKHVRVNDGRVQRFSTYMTGELFHLLATKSILAGSVAAPDADAAVLPPAAAALPSAATVLPSVATVLPSVPALLPPVPDLLPPAFGKGVKASRDSSLLHAAFLVRTRQLLGDYPKTDNYYYLSGLLIGEELKQLTGSTIPLTVVATGRLKESYQSAFVHLGMAGIDIRDADQALIGGHCRLLDLPTDRGDLRTAAYPGG
jgi:2-dehydro-3-deoxygalactonokinase